jgi:NAD(P)-dependent dehydrogenase (short-subunit alcohol dehydrogenase family)
MSEAGMRFKDKACVVIGGNSGIGLSTARGFAAEGGRVAITGRDQQTLDAALAELGEGAVALRSDVGSIADSEAAMAAIGKRFGPIDALVVNAGIGEFAPAEAITPEMWDRVHDVNLRGCFFAAQKALPLMAEGGSIVFTGSIGSVLAVPGNAVYAASKAGLRAVARILAAELVTRKIRVNLVSPGPTETPIINRSGVPPEAVDGLRQVMINAVPMKRMGEPEEIARAILFLSSSEASFITGIDLFVDGGCIEL